MNEPLNAVQQEAVTYFDGPLLIIAGAGSGKTRVITHKIAHIVQEDLAKPHQILAITFTNKAAREMQERIQSMIDVGEKGPMICTFHAFCAHVLRDHFKFLGREANYIIYDRSDQLGLIRVIMKDLELDEAQYQPNKLLTTISLLKNEQIDAETYQSDTGHYFYDETIATLYSAYQTRLLQANAVDFDDMILHTIELLETVPSVREAIQQDFKYVLVDEFQDTNRAQYELCKVLAGYHRQLTVVGDFDQNIYSWRGAKSKNLTQMQADFKDTKVLVMDQNYRSTHAILAAANELIHHNPQEIEKKLWSDLSTGDPLTYYLAFDEVDEARFVAQKIKELVRHGKALNEIVVLYRTNTQSKAFETEFQTAQIPYRIVGGAKFYAYSEVKDVMAYLRLVYNPRDDEAFRRVAVRPVQWVDDQTLGRLNAEASKQNKSLFDMALQEPQQNYGDKLGEFVRLIQTLQAKYGAQSNQQIEGLISDILDKAGYQTKQDSTQKNGINSQIGRLQKLASLATQDGRNLGDFLSDVSLMTELDQTAEQGDCVTLMTLHNAKGLEFETVFVTGFEEGLIPHYKTQFDQQGLQEERRLFYVGLTRAKSHCILTSSHQRAIFGDTWFNDISRFLSELPKDHLNIVVSERLKETGESVLDRLEASGFTYTSFQSDPTGSNDLSEQLSAGQTVSHPSLGDGIIQKIEFEGEDLFYYVQFGKEFKKMMAKYAGIKATRA